MRTVNQTNSRQAKTVQYFHRIAFQRNQVREAIENAICNQGDTKKCRAFGACCAAGSQIGKPREQGPCACGGKKKKTKILSTQSILPVQIAAWPYSGPVESAMINTSSLPSHGFALAALLKKEVPFIRTGNAEELRTGGRGRFMEPVFRAS
jgi:hypothetical protein